MVEDTERAIARAQRQYAREKYRQALIDASVHLRWQVQYINEQEHQTKSEQLNVANICCAHALDKLVDILPVEVQQDVRNLIAERERLFNEAYPKKEGGA